MSYTRDDVIDLIKKDWKLKDISDFTGLPIDSIKKTSQMVKLYKRVADENLENYLKILKHDALLFSRFKVDSELSKAIKYVMEQTNGEKISRAKLRELLDNYSNTNNSIDVGPEMMKFNKLLEQIEYLVNKYSKDDLDFIGLTGYLKDGRLELSNNRAERSIKPFVIDRKNFLFANTPKGATGSAVIFSLIQTAIENGLDPYRYLTWLMKTAKDAELTQADVIQSLLPWNAPTECYVK